MNMSVGINLVESKYHCENCTVIDFAPKTGVNIILIRSEWIAPIARIPL